MEMNNQMDMGGQMGMGQPAPAPASGSNKTMYITAAVVIILAAIAVWMYMKPVSTTQTTVSQQENAQLLANPNTADLQGALNDAGTSASLDSNLNTLNQGINSL